MEEKAVYHGEINSMHVFTHILRYILNLHLKPRIHRQAVADQQSNNVDLKIYKDQNIRDPSIINKITNMIKPDL